MLKLRKYILIIAALIITGSASAQWSGPEPFEFFAMNSFSGNARQYFARYDLKPGGDTLKWYAEFIDSCTINGTWAMIDEMWIYANNTSANSLIGVKGYKNCTAVNSPSFSAYRGFTGNGSTSYINTNYNDSLSGLNNSLTSQSIGIYSRSNINESKYDIGCSVAAYDYAIASQFSNTFYLYMHYTSGLTAGSTDSRGLFTGNRNGNSIKGYKNGTEVITGSIGVRARLNYNIYICCRNLDGVPSNFSTKQISFGFVGGSLTAQQQLNLYNCLQRLLTKIGAAV